MQSVMSLSEEIHKVNLTIFQGKKGPFSFCFGLFNQVAFVEIWINRQGERAYILNKTCKTIKEAIEVLGYFGIEKAKVFGVQKHVPLFSYN